MTKIPSVEERVAKFQKEFWKISGKSAPDLDRKQDEYITEALTADRTALLTELRDSGLLEEKPVNICGFNFKGVTVETEAAVEIIFAYEKIGHNTLARAIKARINKLINPTSV